MDTHTHIHIHTGVYTTVLELCSGRCVVAMALHCISLHCHGNTKNDDWHEALSEVGQEHPSQVNPYLFIRPSIV